MRGGKVGGLGGCEGEQSNTFAILLDACAAAKDMTTAQQVKQDIATAGMPQNTLLCNALLKVCGVGGRAEEAVELFHNMLKAGVHPDGTTFSVSGKVTGGTPGLAIQ